MFIYMSIYMSICVYMLYVYICGYIHTHINKQIYICAHIYEYIFLLKYFCLLNVEVVTC